MLIPARHLLPARCSRSRSAVSRSIRIPRAIAEAPAPAGQRPTTSPIRFRRRLRLRLRPTLSMPRMLRSLRATLAAPTTSPQGHGPYLTVASCTQSTGTQSSCTPTPTGLACTGSVNTSTPGTNSFQVTATDTGLNQDSQSVSYSVVAPTNLQIANLAPGGPVANGGNITYLIAVADAGPANADGVIVTDPLPSNTKFLSGSGTNIACTIVNKKLSCTTTPISSRRPEIMSHAVWECWRRYPSVR